MIKLWGRANSSNVMKVILTLEELGLPYTRVDVGGPFGGTSTPEYRAMNPLGVVPSLEDGDLALFESNAIIRYICNAYAPETTLYPTAPGQRATVEAWMEFQQTALNRPMSVVFQGLIRTPPEKRDNVAITAAITDVAAIWAILDQRLATRDWLAGPDLTLADIVFAPHVHRWLTLPIPGRPNAPYLKAWYDRLLARPIYAQHGAIPIT
jgi:glutathione S-transferase